MMYPVDIATQGYLDSPLSVALDGYLSIAAAPPPPPKPPGGGGNSGPSYVRGTWEHPYERIARLKEQLEREDDEILAVIMAFVEGVNKWRH